MTIFLILIIILIYSVKILDYAYQWQIKEYRLDRFMAYVRESGIVSVFIWRRLRLPAKSPRNAIICTYTFILILLLCAYLPPSLPVYLLIIMMSPFFSFILTFPAIGFTHVLASVKRSQAIEDAIKKISTSPAVFIGITGSYGKTTTKEYLYTILSQQFQVGKTDEHMNTSVGVALSILKNLKPDTQFFIAEIGAYRKGEIRAVCNIISPSFAILTAIGNQHAVLFGSQKTLVETKRELLESLPETGIALVNKDTGHITELQKGVRAKTVWFSKNDADPLIDDSVIQNGVAPNLIPCILLARLLGMKNADIKKGIDILVRRAIKNNFTQGYRGSVVMDNSYNTNLAAFLLTIDSLGKRKERNKIIVSRGIIELGDQKKESYEKIVNALSNTRVVLYTTDADFIKSQNKPVRYFKSEQILYDALVRAIDHKTVIAFEGKFAPQYILKIKAYDIN